jgi:hypothetical protein
MRWFGWLTVLGLGIMVWLLCVPTTVDFYNGGDGAIKCSAVVYVPADASVTGLRGSDMQASGSTSDPRLVPACQAVRNRAVAIALFVAVPTTVLATLLIIGLRGKPAA